MKWSGGMEIEKNFNERPIDRDFVYSPYATQDSRFRMIGPVLQQQTSDVQVSTRARLMQRRISSIVFLIRIHVQSFQTESNHIDVSQTSRFVQNRFTDPLVQHPAAYFAIDVILVLFLQIVDGCRSSLLLATFGWLRCWLLLFANVVEAWGMIFFFKYLILRQLYEKKINFKN